MRALIGSIENPMVRDSKEEVILAHCIECGGEIYEGDTVYKTDEGYIHEDCLEDFVRNQLRFDKGDLYKGGLE